MARSVRVLIGLGSIGVLVAAGLAVGPVAARPVPGDGAAGAATARLVADADGRVRSREGFVGVPAGVDVDNPSVSASLSVTAAANAHLARYGATLGSVDPATAFRRGSVHRAPSGNDVVRYQQVVAGLPVLGGEVVVNVRPDRSLASMLGDLSPAAPVAAARVAEPAAAALARARAAKTSGTPLGRLTAASAGRWLYDPEVVGLVSGLGPRSVWRFEVTGGPAVRRLVLVDDQTGSVLLDRDLIAHVDRVVCDRNNTPAAAEPCTSGFARVEGGPVSPVADVNGAYDLSGVVAEFYDDAVGLDVTALLGVDVGGTPRLSSTVRHCDDAENCPLQNAFWNGVGMFYGDGYASVDDVTGHEMTHGVIERSSNLLYWGQSGAINESLADVMGEIVDHRHPSVGDSPASWSMGEDLAGIGAIRDMSDPLLFGDPDRMTSDAYDNDIADGYDDSGGVHTNSGVGNKTAYLISQGGTFNGHTMTGIDLGDPRLTQTAVLYYDVIRSLVSGSDYADLADVLDQSCQDLVAGGIAGFTAADCTTVHTAGLATELRTTPPNAPQPADAPMTCPAGRTLRVLFDSETGDAAAKFAGPASIWARGSDIGYGENAVSGHESWFGWNADPDRYGEPPTARLTGTTSIKLPKRQQSFLHFHHWRAFEYGITDAGAVRFYDGGTVEIDDRSTKAPAVDAARLPWVNGPKQVLATWAGSTQGGKRAFAGDSFGWVASRANVSTYAGRSIRLQFTSRADRSGMLVGWYLDDITVYTCDPASSGRVGGRW